MKNKPHKSFKIHPVIELDSLAKCCLLGAQYHLEKIIELHNQFGMQTLNDSDFPIDKQKQESAQIKINQFHWHIRAFFWELVASFDTILQWVNQEYELSLHEKDVNWCKIKKRNSKNNLFQVDWLKKRSILKKEWHSDWFYEMRLYRNFAHRSFQFIQSEFDSDYGKTPPTLKKTWLSPAREGQSDYVDIISHLTDYLERMRGLPNKIFIK